MTKVKTEKLGKLISVSLNENQTSWANNLKIDKMKDNFKKDDEPKNQYDLKHEYTLKIRMTSKMNIT